MAAHEPEDIVCRNTECGPATTTLSTITVQSGNTRIVIALLQSKEWIQLKIQEMLPAMTDIGANLQEATDLYQQHEKVLEKLQTKQSPVEELLRQADDLISNQRPRGEVYAAMAENLGLAWKDLNAQLEQRRQILEQAVAFFHTRQQFSDHLELIKKSVSETFLPNTVESATTILNRLKEERKAALGSSMRLLGETQLLLERLCEVATHSMGDSRQLHMQPAARQTAAFVEGQAEGMQDRWRQLEGLWNRRKALLEQCLQRCQLEQLMAELENWLRTRGVGFLSDRNLGDSVANSEILLHEQHKIENQCKERQEQCLKLVKQAEDLQRAGNYAGDELRSGCYVLLSECSELVTSQEHRRQLLVEAVHFFGEAQAALTKLDQIEIHLSTSDSTSLLPTVEEVTTSAIQNGRQILNTTGLTDHGAQGVARKVEELERRKKKLMDICHSKESAISEKTAAFKKFCDKYDELMKWLSNHGQFFVQRTRDMGTTQTAAKSFLEQHEALQHDLMMKGMEVDAFLKTVPVLVRSGGEEAVHGKAEELKRDWSALRTTLEKRILIGQRYLAFLKLAYKVSKEMDDLESRVKEAFGAPSESKFKDIGEKQLSLKQEMMQLSNNGKNFLQDALKVDDLYLNMTQPCATVEDTLARLDLRSVSLGTLWLNFQNDMSATKDSMLQWEQILKESQKVSKNCLEVERRMFPVIPQELHRTDSILTFLEKTAPDVLPQIKTVQKEVENLLKKLERTKLKEGSEAEHSELQRKLRETNETMQKRITDFQIIVSMMVAFFRNYEELEKLVAMQESQYRLDSLPSEVNKLEALVRDLESNKNTAMELFKFSNAEAMQISRKIDEAEPPLAGAQDKEKIHSFLISRKEAFEKASDDYKSKLEHHNQLCIFFRDMHMINQQIQDLNAQLSSIRGNYGESLPSSLHTSEAFLQFEKTIETLQVRIHQFVSTAEMLIRDRSVDGNRVRTEMDTMQRKWATFRTEVAASRRLIDVALEYHRTIEESEEWMKEGSRLLISVTRRSTTCRQDMQAEALRREIRDFLDAGRAPQEERMRRISHLSTQLYGHATHPSSSVVSTKNKEMLESFSVISSELNTLTRNIQQAEHAKTELQVKEERTPPQRAPLFTRHLVDTEVPEGTKFTFECQVEGDPTPQVQWFKDGILVENNPDYGTTVDQGTCRLTIEETFSEDTAVFVCRATNPAGVAESRSQLLVKESRAPSELIPPHFVQEPSPCTIQEGESHQLDCQVFGNPLPLVSWFRDDSCIDYCTGYCISCNNGSCSLRIEEASPLHAGRYTCRAVNPAGEAACSVDVVVRTSAPSERPCFVTPLSNVMARAGQKLRLECTLSGQPQPQVSWLHNSKAIKETRDTKLHLEGSTATLVITEAFPKDAGTYTVIARNKAGEAVSSCNVSVKGRLPMETSDSEIASDIEPAKPQVKQHLVDQTVSEGKKVRMDCIIVGQPEPEVIWYQNGKPVKESDDFQLLFEGDRCTLIIEVAYQEDAGTYKCVAINSGGEASSSCQLHVNTVSELIKKSSHTMQKDIILTVQKHPAPKFLKLLESINATEGQEVVLECQAAEEPGLSLSWFKDGAEISSSLQYQIQTDVNGTSTLRIPSAMVHDRGTYSVRALNGGGDAQSICSVVVSPCLPLKSWETPHQQPPNFLMHVESQTRPMGGSARFEALVEGTPRPTVRWNFQGKPVPRDDHHEVGSDEDKKHWLVIRNLEGGHIGRYSAIAENDSGIATTSALLTAEDPSFGNEISLSEEHRAQSMVMTQKSVVRTSTISSMSEVSDIEYQPPDFPTFPSLQSQQLVMDSTCVQVAPPLPDTQPVSVIQKHTVPPRFIQPVSTAVITEGEKLLLEAQYEGDPDPTIDWSKDEAPLQNSIRLQWSSGSGRTSMFVAKSLESDSGRYSCTATNAGGKATSIAEVKVKPYREAPKFKKKLEAAVVKSGTKVEWEVEVSGVPNPDIQWYRDGNLISDSPDFRISSRDKMHSLVIREVFPDDSGSYMVIAGNPAGETRSIADLIVEEDPKSPEEERKVTYQQFTSLQQTKQMFTKISSGDLPSLEPYRIAPPDVKAIEPTPAKTPSPPPMPAVATKVWTKPKPAAFPAAMTETLEPELVFEPEEEFQVDVISSFQDIPMPHDVPMVATLSQSFVKQSVVKFSKPDEVKPAAKIEKSQPVSLAAKPVYQNGCETRISHSYSNQNSVKTVSSSSAFDRSSVVQKSVSGSNVPKLTFVPKPIVPIPSDQLSRVPVWQPKKISDTSAQTTAIPPSVVDSGTMPCYFTENKLCATDSKSTSTTSCQTAGTPTIHSSSESSTTTRTSYSTEEISITKKYEMVVEHSSEGVQSSDKIVPKPIIKKEASDESKPKKEVVIEEVPVLGAEVKPPQFSKVRGAESVRKIYTDV